MIIIAKTDKIKHLFKGNDELSALAQLIVEIKDDGSLLVHKDREGNSGPVPAYALGEIVNAHLKDITK